MLVRKKYNITRTFEASLLIELDKSETKNEIAECEFDINFISSVKNLDSTQLTTKQNVVLTTIVQKLRKKGYIK